VADFEAQAVSKYFRAIFLYLRKILEKKWQLLIGCMSK